MENTSQLIIIQRSRVTPGRIRCVLVDSVPMGHTQRSRVLFNVMENTPQLIVTCLCVRRAIFTYLKTSSFILLYKNMVRSHLDYCSSVWSPYRKGDMENIEKVQKKATKLISELKHMNYIDRLKKCQLPTLHY